MLITKILTFSTYFLIILFIGFWSGRKQKSDTDFVMGGRKLNFWLTALSAHASDMSSWLFLGYPAVIYMYGFFNAWAAIGLTTFMFLNWQFIAPKIRTITEKTKSLTLFTYFEKRFDDPSGSIRIISAVISLLFYIFYITSGLVGMGLLTETLLGIPYWVGISLGVLIVTTYVFLGGYTAVAWIDLFQGFFLLGVIIFVPLYLINTVGGWSNITTAVQNQGVTTSLFPDFSKHTIEQIITLGAGWGLGYFGQPHIITKFMGIRKVTDMYKAKYVGISWQILALAGATLIGFIGIYVFPDGLSNSSLVVLEVVKKTLPAFITGLVLCAIIAATTNVMAAQILVVASSLAEDFHKKIVHKTASAKELLWVSRFSVVITALIAYIIALFKVSTIYELVLYSWSGLGAAFGPILLLSLYSNKINKAGAFSGILVGGVTIALWPLIGSVNNAMIPGFIFSICAIFIVSYLTKHKIPYRRINKE